MTIHVGMLLYPGLTQLDLTAPFEVVQRLPDVHVHLVWKNLDIVVADSQLGLRPTTAMDACPPLDVVFVPGGSGQTVVLQDDSTLAFLRHHGRTARWVTSVCTGSLLLGAAGLLEGYGATTHWAFMDLLATFGAHPVRKRVVVDRNRATGAGVTAGIELGLRLAVEMAGERVAKAIQLGLEYDPEPPFRSGHPDVAEAEILSMVRDHHEELVRNRKALVDQIVKGHRGRQ